MRARHGQGRGRTTGRGLSGLPYQLHTCASAWFPMRRYLITLPPFAWLLGGRFGPVVCMVMAEAMAGAQRRRKRRTTAPFGAARPTDTLFLPYPVTTYVLCALKDLLSLPRPGHVAGKAPAGKAASSATAEAHGKSFPLATVQTHATLHMHAISRR